MVLVVLLTMMLLAALLAASSQLTLSSRRTTADQAASLRAQYVAESGVALVRSRLQDVQNLLSAKSVIDGKDNFEVPGITTSAVVKAHAERFCGKSSWVPTADFAQSRGLEDPKPYPNALQCVIDSSSTFSSEQASVLADYLKQSAYSVLPADERPTNLTSRGMRLSWWNTLLSNTDQTLGDTKYKLSPVKVVQLTNTNYRFYIKAVDVRARGIQDGATRVLSTNRTINSDWWFEIVLPSLLDDVLMTNHHRMKTTGNYNPAGAPGVNFSNQTFDGSIHTNEKYLFTNNSSAQFKGKISSVGCTDLPQTARPTSGDCAKTPGVYINGAQQTPPAATTNIDQWVANKIAESPRTVQFVKKGTPAVIDYEKTDFTATYKPLPENENDQKQAAIDGGLTLKNDTLGVELIAGGDNGEPLTDYDATLKKWTEPSQMYQYIRYLKSQTVEKCSWTGNLVFSDIKDRNGNYSPDSAWNATISSKRYSGNSGGKYRYWRDTEKCSSVKETGIDTDNEYRVDKDGNLYKKNSSGSWVSQNKKFNGVIYGESFQTVRGPARKDGKIANGDISNAPPAVASFSGLTLASTNDITIDTDLTVSDTPCTYAATKASPPCTKRPMNILGLYTQKGDIIMSTATGNDLNLHAALMASEGQVTAEKYDDRPNQGDVKLIGSLIENWYGAFGLVSGVGYGRDFTYDQRLQEGTVPPYFPVSPRWLAQDARATGISMADLVLQQAPASKF